MPQNAGRLSHDPAVCPEVGPRRGQKIVIRVAGYPPFRRQGSLRNQSIHFTTGL